MILPDTGGVARLRARLLPPLAGRAWRLLGGYALASTGVGLMAPFLIIYLHRVRGLDLATAGAVLSVSSLAGLLIAAAGGLIDRVGPARFLACALLLATAGSIVFIRGNGVADAFVAALLVGAGMASAQPSVSTLLVHIVPEHHRSEAFGLSYAVINLGFGAGATVGGVALDVHAARTFALVFLCAAGLFLAFSLQLVLTRETGGRTGQAQRGIASPPKPAAGRPSAMRVVLADRRLLALTALNTLFVTVGYSQVDAAFPAWVTGPAHQGTAVVGLAFTANTVTIVVSQLIVLRLVQGRSRLRTAAVAGVAFAVTWVIVLMAGEAPGGLVATVGLIGALVPFGLGETLLAPSLPAAVNDLAPDAIRGRYNAVFFLSPPLGSIIGPLLSGVALAHGFGAPLIIGLMAACLLGSALALRLEPLVHPVQSP